MEAKSRERLHIAGAVGLYVPGKDGKEKKQRGIIIAEDANWLTMAHELGHALGLKDIQVCGIAKTMPKPGTKEEWCPKDWSNGYYAKRKGYHPVLTERLLMNNDGANRLDRLDIPSGQVFGADPSSRTGMINVGLNSLKRDNPDLH